MIGQYIRCIFNEFRSALDIKLNKITKLTDSFVTCKSRGGGSNRACSSSEKEKLQFSLTPYVEAQFSSFRVRL